MVDSVYKVIELVGTSSESWEKAAAAAIKTASKSLRDLRIAEIVSLDMQLKDGTIEKYRAKVKVSFKYEDWENHKVMMNLKNRHFVITLYYLDKKGEKLYYDKKRS